MIEKERIEAEMRSVRNTAAMMAMEALIAETDNKNSSYYRMTVHEILLEKKGLAEIIARDAVIYADALINELQKPTNNKED